MLLLTGCYSVYGELLGEHVEPGGFVRAAIDGAPQKASTGLGAAKAEPLAINGYSTELTFGLVAGDDPAGSTALVAMAQPNAQVELKLTAATRTALQVHVGGTGCKATLGTIKLKTNDNAKLISGEFDATGVNTTDSKTACHIVGTLTDIPLER